MIALNGFTAGLSLIVAIGAQNAFVLRQGLARNHVVLVVAICAISDVVLIAAGVAGLGRAVRDHPDLLAALRWFGVAVLAAYGLRSLISARKAGSLAAASGKSGESDSRAARTLSAGAAAATVAALTWLHPHVYLDTVLLLGTLSTQHGEPGNWVFGGGAAAASLLWFGALGLGAQAASERLSRPGTWRIIEIVIGVVMLLMALKLAMTPI